MLFMEFRKWFPIVTLAACAVAFYFINNSYKRLEQEMYNLETTISNAERTVPKLEIEYERELAQYLLQMQTVDDDARREAQTELENFMKFYDDIQTRRAAESEEWNKFNREFSEKLAKFANKAEKMVTEVERLDNESKRLLERFGDECYNEPPNEPVESVPRLNEDALVN